MYIWRINHIIVLTTTNKVGIHKFKLLDAENTLKDIKVNYIFSTIIHINLVLCFLKYFGLIKTSIILRPSNIINSQKNKAFSLKKILLFKISKIFLNEADLIFSISKDIKKELNQLKVNKKIISINNAIVDKKF